MALEFKFPDVGEGIHEGRIVEWLVKVGDKVEEDQPFVKVETDKAVVELPAPTGGMVLALNAKPGDLIHVGDVIAVFGDEGEKVRPAETAKPETPSKSAEPSVTKVEKAPEEPTKKSASVPAKAGAILATPHTRAYARKQGVDLATVTPTGKHSRITNEDVDRAATGGKVPTRPSKPAPAGTPKGDIPKTLESTDYGEVERVPASHLRKVIADAMVLSRRTSAHVTHVDEADVTDLVSTYKKLKPVAEEKGVKLSLTAVFIKMLSVMLKKHPLLNASYDEDNSEIVLKKYCNIGMAVDTSQGLIVPVLKNADKKNLLQIADEVANLAEKARNRALSLEDLKGGSFTITNVGPIGGLMATPIIHQPELAIAAFFGIKKRPVVLDGEIVPRDIMNVALSFDHRIIDGAEGARATTTLVKLLETPGLLLLEV